MLESNFSNFSNSTRPFILEKGSKKYSCPNCGKKSLKRYIHTETGEYLPDQYGRCDHENSCVPHYHLNPYLDGYVKTLWNRTGKKVTKVTRVTFQNNLFFSQSKPKPVFFDFETFKQTLNPERYASNVFLQNLHTNLKYPFDVDDITKVVQLYRLGTVVNGYRAGAVTFPFIDVNNNIRAVQVKQFDTKNHTTGTDFLHSIIEKDYAKKNIPLPEWLNNYKNQDKRVSCLFGEQLLSKYPNNPIGLVEAPKTAIYATLYFGFPETPESIIWLAVYNKSSFSIDRLKVLQGRKVVVFPDLSEGGSTFNEWKAKNEKFGTRFKFSDYLEKIATPRQREQGADIADVLVMYDWRNFRKVNVQEQPPQEPVQPPQIEPEKDINLNILEVIEPATEQPPQPQIQRIQRLKKETPESWSQSIDELEKYFSSIHLPIEPLRLNESSLITDCSLFIESHLTTLKQYNGNKTFLPYLERLRQFREVLESDESDTL
jgi:predicted RNA-binding Zn-ribbon protein involved in translation (DUF1610 family)